MRDKNIFYIMIGIALVLVISVGYALFSESIQIKGTAKAEGSFDIVASCQTQVTNSTILTELQNWWQNKYNEPLPARQGITSSSCGTFDNTTNTQTYDAVLNYPGAREYYTIKFTNNGTIDAYYTGSNQRKVVLCEDNTTTTPVQIDESSSKCNVVNSFPSSAIGKYTSIIDMETQFIVLAKPNGDIVTPSSPAADLADFMDENENFVLKPGYSMYVIGVASIPDNIDNNTGILNIAMRSEFKYSFQQKQVS